MPKKYVIEDYFEEVLCYTYTKIGARLWIRRHKHVLYPTLRRLHTQ